VRSGESRRFFARRIGRHNPEWMTGVVKRVYNPAFDRSPGFELGWRVFISNEWGVWDVLWSDTRPVDAVSQLGALAEDTEPGKLIYSSDEASFARVLYRVNGATSS
jgi:hypothetical protein